MEPSWMRFLPVQIHHLSYSRLGEELKQDLSRLCRPCHLAAHLLVDDLHVQLRSSVDELQRLANDHVGTHHARDESRRALELQRFSDCVLLGMIEGAARALNLPFEILWAQEPED